MRSVSTPAPGRATAGRGIAAPISRSTRWSASRSLRELRGGLLALSFTLLGGLGAGCSTPCETLASHICGCSLNKTEEAQCLQRVTSSTREATDADNVRCEQLLDTCTCDALEKNEPAACGLANEGSDGS